jgi:hypothetical protein
MSNPGVLERCSGEATNPEKPSHSRASAAQLAAQASLTMAAKGGQLNPPPAKFKSQRVLVGRLLPSIIFFKLKFHELSVIFP